LRVSIFFSKFALQIAAKLLQKRNAQPIGTVKIKAIVNLQYRMLKLRQPYSKKNKIFTTFTYDKRTINNPKMSLLSKFVDLMTLAM